MQDQRVQKERQEQGKLMQKERQEQGKPMQEQQPVQGKSVQDQRMQEEQEPAQTITERKRLLRKAALVRRDSLTQTQRTKKSGQIAECLYAHPWYREAEFLLVYASYLSEVSTEEIIRHALLEGKQVYCPAVLRKREMVFCALDARLSDAVMSFGLAAMSKDCRGIPQPDIGVCAQYRYQPEQSLMLMPGCVFDDQGNRIGYGGGFYDSFLEKQPMRTIALFFDCQHTDVRIEAEPHDVPPDLILTESGFGTVEIEDMRESHE